MRLGSIEYFSSLTTKQENKGSDVPTSFFFFPRPHHHNPSPRSAAAAAATRNPDHDEDSPTMVASEEYAPPPPPPPPAQESVLLDSNWLKPWMSKTPLNDSFMGTVVFLRTYARRINNRKETFPETIARVVEGLMRLQKSHMALPENSHLAPWDDAAASVEAKKIFETMMSLQFLPPGRSMWALGTPIIDERKLNEALFNCAFISTKDMGVTEPAYQPICWLMNLLMLGVGVGSDVRGRGQCAVRFPRIDPVVMRRMRRAVDICTLFKDREDMSDLFEIQERRRVSDSLYVDWLLSPSSKASYATRWLETMSGDDVATALCGSTYERAALSIRCLVMELEHRRQNNIDGQGMACYYMHGEELRLNDPMYVAWLTSDESSTSYWASSLRIHRTLWEAKLNDPDADLLADTTYVKPLPIDAFRVELERRNQAHDDVVNDRVALFQGATRLQWVHPGDMEEPDDFGDFVRAPEPAGGDGVSESDMWTQARGLVVEQMDASKCDYDDEFKETVVQMIDLWNDGRKPSPGFTSQVCDIPDTREGWVAATKVICQDFLPWGAAAAAERPYERMLSYHLIRPAGLPLKTFGGTSSGPRCLVELHRAMRRIFYCTGDGNKLGTKALASLINEEGRCVCMGNIRRTAEIILGDLDDEEFVTLKDYTVNPDRMNHGWASNNTVIVENGKTYDWTSMVDQLYTTGDPGFFFIDNARDYSRMCDAPDHRDKEALGTNPCGEQTMESYELCNLGCVLVDKIETFERFIEVLDVAVTFCKTVSLALSSHKRTRDVMARNRRLGISLDGCNVADMRLGREEFIRWMSEGYDYIVRRDKELSERFGVNRSIKVTTVKPGGTIPLMVNSLGACNFPKTKRYYIRHVTFGEDDTLLRPLNALGFKIAKSHYYPRTMVVSFPQMYDQDMETDIQAGIWRQLDLIACVQRYWSDNQVSSTVVFDKVTTTREDIIRAVEKHRYQLKSLTFMGECSKPVAKEHRFRQLPYKACDEAKYRKHMSRLKDVSNFSALLQAHSRDATPESFCASEKCEISSLKSSALEMSLCETVA